MGRQRTGVGFLWGWPIPGSTMRSEADVLGAIELPLLALHLRGTEEDLARRGGPSRVAAASRFVVATGAWSVPPAVEVH
jgi:hypothetical protein